MEKDNGITIEELRDIKFEDLEDGLFLESLNEYMQIAISDLERAGKDPEKKRRVSVTIELSRSEDLYTIVPKVRLRLATDYPDVVEQIRFKRHDPRQLNLIAGGRR